jgi:hypothetical protein
VPTDEQEKKFATRWAGAVSLYTTGYQECTDNFIQLATIPELTDADKKKEVCMNFREAKENLRSSEEYFQAAKSSSSAGSSSGFIIGMVIPRVDSISADAEDTEIACMKAELADRNGDPAGFRQSLIDARTSLGDMKRLNAELEVLSNDFP